MDLIDRIYLILIRFDVFDQPQHFCMKDSIQYDEMLPTHGDHRPLWPVYGEYLFVPPQRWLHNIEVI